MIPRRNRLLLVGLAVGFVASAFCVSAFTGQQGESGESYLTTVFIEGVPYQEARLAGLVFADRFVEVLQDRERASVWVNAVVAVGASGAVGADQSIIDFFAGLADEEPLAPAACRAALSVPLALGYHVNVSNSRAALGFLERLAGGAVQPGWRCEYHASIEESAQDVRFLAIRSLGVSGIAGAKSILEDLRNDIRPESRLSVAVNDALEIHSEVMDVGLTEYYSRRHERARQQ